MNDVWKFPSSNGGRDEGFNDPGIEIFAGEPFKTMVREVIQNSLDAGIDSETPVTVLFEFMKIERNQFPGADALFGIFKQCLDESKDEKEKSFFTKATRLLKPKARRLTCLKIADSGTIGLGGDYQKRDGPWHAITKGTGITDKRDSSAGGSFGIGKSAPLTVSQLRTVFYATMYKEEGGEEIFRAQGKSVLKSHNDTVNRSGYTQGTGFYGDPNECKPIADEIPRFLKPKKQGAVVFIPGFVENANWQRNIVAAVVCNYFCAINQGMLKVQICDESGETKTIQKDTLDQCFQNAIDSQGDSEEIKNSHCYYRAMQSEPTKSSQLANLGHCKLWVLKEEGLQMQVALLRKTGMLITDSQRGLKRWTGCADFAAVFMCDSDEGNQLLRAMENPQHNAFESERAIEEHKDKCKKALQELVDWVKTSVHNIVKPKETESSDIDELAEFFSDLDASSESIPGDSEPDIEGKPIFTLKPLKRTRQTIESEEDGDDGGASETGGGDGKNGDGTGEGDGDGAGGTGNRGSKPSVQLQNVRIVADKTNPKNKKLYFTPTTSGRIAVGIFIMGDDGNTEKIALDTNGNGFILVDAQVGVRMSQTVTLRDVVSDSIAVKAFQQSTQNSNDENTAD